MHPAAALERARRDRLQDGGARPEARTGGGREVEHGAGVGAAQRVFLEAGVPAAA